MSQQSERAKSSKPSISGTPSRPTKADVQFAREEGFKEGLEKGRMEILDFLQHAYLEDPGRPDRGTPKAEAILEVARDAQQHFVAKANPLKKGRRR